VEIGLGLGLGFSVRHTLDRPRRSASELDMIEAVHVRGDGDPTAGLALHVDVPDVLTDQAGLRREDEPAMDEHVFGSSRDVSHVVIVTGNGCAYGATDERH